MKKMHLIRQHDEKDCGAACLSMILEYYGLKLPMAVIRDAIQVDQNGANIYGMLEGASRFGLKGDARGGSAEDVWEVLSGYDFSDPVIIRVLNRGVYEHYVVVSDFKGNKLQICDPDMGKRTMTREEFQQLCRTKIVFLDGATGTNLQKAGMPTGVCPEAWILEHPDTMMQLQRAYFEAGSDIVLAPTFTANRIKLDEYGLVDKIEEMNHQLVAISKEAAGDKILKVIIETCYLTEEEKIKLCQCVTNAKADYIKTSTGFGTGGATIEDIRLFAQNIGSDVKMKAAGGVKSREDLEMFLAAGCDRIGTSSAVKMLETE